MDYAEIHASTFGGNALACRATIATFEDVSHPWLEWEGLGLREFARKPATAAWVMKRLLDRSILAQHCAHNRAVPRVEPPPTVDAEACERV